MSHKKLSRSPVFLLVKVRIEHLLIDHVAASDSIFPCDAELHCIHREMTGLNGLCLDGHPRVTWKR